MKRERIDQKAILEYKIDKGKTIGIEKDKIEVAKNLLQSGFTVDSIIQLTNLSKEHLENLKRHTSDETSVVSF